jgi:hypothetical protein
MRDKTWARKSHVVWWFAQKKFGPVAHNVATHNLLLLTSSCDAHKYIDENDGSYIGSHGSSRDFPQTKSSVQVITHTTKFEGSTLPSSVSLSNHWLRH